MARRALGIDFGEKRIGVAISDPDGRVAVALRTLHRTNDASAIRQLADLADSEAIDVLVLGEPRKLDGSRGEAALRVSRFADKLARATGLPVEFVDESLTSHEAESRLRDAGVDPRKHPDRVDALAAQIVLQEALDRRRDD